MDRMVNGTVPPGPQMKQLNVRPNILPIPSGAKIIFATTEGLVVATVEFQVSDNSYIQLLPQLFADVVRQMTGGLQVVGAGVLPGLKPGS